MDSILQRIADELSVRASQVSTTVTLLDEGATVPFIARYRKERTGGLDDTQLRFLETRLHALRELEKRRDTIINSIQEQGKLSETLQRQLTQAQTRTELEDLYLPYKPKRRTKAQMAREAGVEPLALSLLADANQAPEELAQQYLNADAGFADSKGVLEGARQILMEMMAEQAALTHQLRTYLWEQGRLMSQVIEGKQQEGHKFRDYFDYIENIAKVPSHRALALLRGRNEGVLDIRLDVPVEAGIKHPCEVQIAQAFNIKDQGRAADAWLSDTVRWAWKVKLHTRLETDLLGSLRDSADQEAIRVFGANLKDLLLASPAGAKVTMGLDPGLRTGVKVAVVDGTGKLLDTATIYPHVPQKQWDQSLATLATLCQKHQVSLISIGNGTASRETDQLAAELMKRHADLKLTKLIISEAGASVYSASELAAKEFPDLDVSLRGAVSIARRLQDPLAELVKIEPKSIGVGQYQHDVNQNELAQALDGVVEDCVNAVGVDVNMASAALLSRIAGLNRTLADNIVLYRNEQGVFRNRKQLKKVPRLGDKTFEQAAGFLRIRDGDEVLDQSAVHPEAYALVAKMAQQSGQTTKALVGNTQAVRQLQPEHFVNEQFGLPTVRDILVELEKPGRDPRPEFVTASFKEGIETMNDLQPGMVLEGVVSNVANFGAFVDIGVHQDGLVHVSQLANKFVKDPREVVRTGDVVKVRVEEVDVARKRISLTMRLDQASEKLPADTNAQPKQKQKQNNPKATQTSGGRGKQSQRNEQSAGHSAMAEAFAKARK